MACRDACVGGQTRGVAPSVLFCVSSSYESDLFCQLAQVFVWFFTRLPVLAVRSTGSSENSSSVDRPSPRWACELERSSEVSNRSRLRKVARKGSKSSR